MVRSIDKYVKAKRHDRGNLVVEIDEMVRQGHFKPGHRVTVKGDAYEIAEVGSSMILTDPGIPFGILTLKPCGPMPSELWLFSPAGESSEVYSICGEGHNLHDGEAFIVMNRTCDGTITVAPKKYLLNNLHIFRKVEADAVRKAERKEVEEIIERVKNAAS